MTAASTRIEIRENSADTYGQLRDARRQTLVGVEDDMWATFADVPEPHALAVDHRVVGSCSIDDDNQLDAFHMDRDFEGTAPEVLAHVLEPRGITAAIASTVDAAFLCLTLAIVSRSEPVALMYERVADSAVTDTRRYSLSGTFAAWSLTGRRPPRVGPSPAHRVACRATPRMRSSRNR